MATTKYIVPCKAPTLNEICALCGRRYGAHFNYSCRRGDGAGVHGVFSKWGKKPQKIKVAKNSTSANKSYKTALVSIRKIDSMRISNAEKISKIAAVLLGLNPVKKKPYFV